MPNETEQPTLLIVEDNSFQHSVYKALAKKFGFQLQMVMSCKDALAALDRPEPFAIILMDLNLSDTNGCDCAKLVREIDTQFGRHTPIVAVTGHTQDDSKASCLAAGMDDFLAKPFSLDDFKTMIDKWLLKS
jgi:CheY-like chemotaxis protein